MIVGSCFNRYESPRLITTVSCAVDHDGEVFATGELQWPVGDLYPGETAARRNALPFCYRAFEPYVGQLYELSDFEIGVSMPSRSAFEGPDAVRRFVCYLGLSGEFSLGSARDSGR